ncbi:MAG: M20/M25/M40 family metallo-hydrolase [Bacteroidales bacterium]|nr:M20/M25/M40 family metallo-hydrolase [Bacteroidales bacterium]
MKKLFVSLALLAMVFGSERAQAQVSELFEWASKIKAEGLGRSQVEELSQYMTDYVGSRLTASRQKRRADSLMLVKLQELGLSAPRSEFATEFTRGGWDVVKTYAAMTSPYYCAFSVNPRAWSGSTDGLVKGECIVFDAQTKEDLEQYRGKVAGKILLIPSTRTVEINFDPLATRYDEKQLEALTQDNRADVRPRSGGLGQGFPRDFLAIMELRQAMADFYKTEKPLCIVNGSGTFNVPSGSGVNYKAGDPEPVPEIAMPLEDHGRMIRLIRKGHKVEMELELINRFSDDTEVHNIYAEIPGTDAKLKDEIVLIGAHYDSWHGGTGAADNASGCITMVEAMRILKEVGFKPKRTIRLALWGGEEQGLFGSRGYLNQYLYKEGKKLPGFDKFALYLNMDNGSGRFRGIYLERNDGAFPFFEAWMKSIESLGFQYLSPRTTGSTDHVTFNRLGLPSYQFIQDELEYFRTYHTLMDTYERLSLSDLRVNATIVAWLAACAANDPGRVPVNPAVNLDRQARPGERSPR